MEQTINADAANKLTGIINLTNSASARQRWCKSHSLRTTIISHVLDEVGLKCRQDITADLQPERIKISERQLEKLLNNIRQNINPFSPGINENYLYNISTGQAANEDIADFLINIEIKGN